MWNNHAAVERSSSEQVAHGFGAVVFDGAGETDTGGVDGDVGDAIKLATWSLERGAS
jgi:hypothetical protein